MPSVRLSACHKRRWRWRRSIPRQTYIRYETAERRITVVQAIAVAEALGLSFEQFARRVDVRLAELQETTQADVTLAAWDKRREPGADGGGL